MLSERVLFEETLVVGLGRDESSAPKPVHETKTLQANVLRQQVAHFLKAQKIAINKSTERAFLRRR